MQDVLCTPPNTQIQPKQHKPRRVTRGWKNFPITKYHHRYDDNRPKAHWFSFFFFSFSDTSTTQKIEECTDGDRERSKRRRKDRAPERNSAIETFFRKSTIMVIILPVSSDQMLMFEDAFYSDAIIRTVFLRYSHVF